MHFVMIRDLVVRSVYRPDCGGINVIMILTCLAWCIRSSHLFLQNLKVVTVNVD